jgi:hypothetical protein
MRTPSKQIKLLLFADLLMANGTKLNVIDGYRCQIISKCIIEKQQAVRPVAPFFITELQNSIPTLRREDNSTRIADSIAGNILNESVPNSR